MDKPLFDDDATETKTAELGDVHVMYVEEQHPDEIEIGSEEE